MFTTYRDKKKENKQELGHQNCLLMHKDVLGGLVKGLK
jgi:hypothetical protein